MSLIILIIIGFAGSNAITLRWQAFAGLAGLTLPAMALKIVTSAPALERMGESTAFLHDPVYIASNCLISWGIWSTVYALGFWIGKWRRKKR